MNHQGQVALWRYRQARSGYRGFHTTANGLGAASMIRSLMAIRTGQNHRIPLVSVTPAILAVPNNSNDHAVGYQTLVIRAVTGEGIQRVSHAHPVVTVEASHDSLAQFIEGYESIAAGQGDFTIGPDEHNLWFWWWPQRG